MIDIDRENPHTGTIDGVIPGQPYDKQWYMKYFDHVFMDFGDDGRWRKRIVSFKKNRFTGVTYFFSRPQEGNRWNEPGLGWGCWVRL